jgi:DNA-binding beta-propeller fold protein YncE
MKSRNLLKLFGLMALVVLFACKKDDAKPVVPSLYFIDSSSELIQKLSPLDNTAVIDTIKDVATMSGVGIAYDNVNKKIFFSDFYDADTPNGRIWKMNLDGTSAEAIVTGLLDPYGIALDQTGKKVYWTDDEGNIGRSNFDGTSPDTSLVYIPSGKMRAIALDKANNKMYFYEVKNDNLYVANLDGTNKSVLITGAYGYAIFIDTVNGKIYFDDTYGPALKRANLDGTGIVEIYKDLAALPEESRIYGITINYSTNKLIWSNRDAGEIYMANLNGTSKETLATGLDSPRGICLVK